MSDEAARSIMDHARIEVMEGGGEMQKIKAALRIIAKSFFCRSVASSFCRSVAPSICRSVAL